MGVSCSIVKSKLDDALPWNLDHTEGRRELIRNVIAHIRTDAETATMIGLFRPLGEKKRYYSYSFQYIVTQMSDLSWTVAIALRVGSRFRWKVEAKVSKNESDRFSTSFSLKACDALNNAVSKMLLDGIQCVSMQPRDPTPAVPLRPSGGNGAVTPQAGVATREDGLPPGYKESI